MSQQNRRVGMDLLQKFENLKCSDHPSESINFLNLNDGKPCFCQKCVLQGNYIQLAQIQELLEKYQPDPEVERTQVELVKIIKILKQAIEASVQGIQQKSNQMLIRLDKLIQDFTQKANPIGAVINLVQSCDQFTQQRVKDFVPKFKSIIKWDGRDWQLNTNPQQSNMLQQKLNALKQLEIVKSRLIDERFTILKQKYSIALERLKSTTEKFISKYQRVLVRPNLLISFEVYLQQFGYQYNKTAQNLVLQKVVSEVYNGGINDAEFQNNVSQIKGFFSDLPSDDIPEMKVEDADRVQIARLESKYKKELSLALNLLFILENLQNDKHEIAIQQLYRFTKTCTHEELYYWDQCKTFYTLLPFLVCEVYMKSVVNPNMSLLDLTIKYLFHLHNNVDFQMNQKMQLQLMIIIHLIHSRHTHNLELSKMTIQYLQNQNLQNEPSQLRANEQLFNDFKAQKIRHLEEQAQRLEQLNQDSLVDGIISTLEKLKSKYKISYFLQNRFQNSAFALLELELENEYKKVSVMQI